MNRFTKALVFLVFCLLASFQVQAACTKVSAIGIDGNVIPASSMIAYLNNPCFPAMEVDGPLVVPAGMQPGGTNALAPLVISNYPMGSVALASIGTNTADVAGQFWITEVFVPVTKTITKISFLQGGTATTDNTLVAIFDTNGKFLTSSALTGVVLSGANTFQQQTLLSSVTLAGPGVYYVAVQGNGTAAGAIQTLSALYNNVRTGVLAGVFGTVPTSITPPTTFTAANGPVIQLF